MAGRLTRTVVLVGMMGAGKTAVGAHVARMLQVPFLDADDQIEKAAARTIAEIFERDGEAFFRAKEAQVLGRLLDGEPVVLSTGGGAFLAAENRRLVAERGVSVWLRADLDLLWQRVRHKNTRPLLRTANPRETLRSLLAAREPLYREAAVAVDARPEWSAEETAGRVVAALRTETDALGPVDAVHREEG